MALAPNTDSRLTPKSSSPRLAGWHRGQGAIPEGVLNRPPLGGIGAGSPAPLAVVLPVLGKRAVLTDIP